MITFLVALYSVLDDEQIWMLRVGGIVLGVGLFIGGAWTSWDVLRPLVVPHVEYVWWWLRDLLGFEEEQQESPSLAGLTIVRPRRTPKRARQSLAELARPVRPATAHGSDLLGLKADVS